MCVSGRWTGITAEEFEKLDRGDILVGDSGQMQVVTGHDIEKIKDEYGEETSQPVVTVGEGESKINLFFDPVIGIVELHLGQTQELVPVQCLNNTGAHVIPFRQKMPA